jgi:hypothetical protein
MPIIDQLDDSGLCIPNIKDIPGPNFENEADRVSSIIHAGYGEDGRLTSEDLLTGRRYGSQMSAFATPSQPPVSVYDKYVFRPEFASIRGGSYKNKGPIKGRY